MTILDNENMHWRVRKIDRLAKRYYWWAKYYLQLGATEKVDKVSMVVVGRNDNYGGDFSDRLKATIDWNYNHLPNPELIYVEWNTVPDRPSDTEWISKRYPNSKCFMVPNEIHRQLSTNPKIPMMEYYAKNIGLREAGNDWIMILNADVFLGYNALKNITKLNKKYVYGTHYINIVWDQKPISDYHLTDHKLVKNLFSTNHQIKAVVGNFILTHRSNWMQMTGYDENLAGVRAGVDTNGLFQLLHLGVKPMVIGDHYHLDHAESMIKGGNSTHGDVNKSTGFTNIPYQNNPSWGLREYEKVKVAENVWQLTNNTNK